MVKKKLEFQGIITKENHPENKKTKLYILIEKGLSLIPMIVGLTLWGDENLRDLNPNMYDGELLGLLKFGNKVAILRTIK